MDTEKKSNETQINQFNKIQLWNNMANQIAYFAFQHGNQTIFDIMDLKCGGIPDGAYEQIIDLQAQDEFISLYTQIAENRFAWAVNVLLEMSEKAKPVIKEFMFRTGKEMNIEEINSAAEAFEIYKSFVLDGMPDKETKNVLETSENLVRWEKVFDTHKNAWEKAEGELNFYYELQTDFISGLFSNTNYAFKTDGNVFEITKN